MKKSTLANLLAAALVGGVTQTYATSLNYADFSNVSGLQVNGNAAQATSGDGQVLRLTPSAPGQSGSAFSLNAIALNSGYSFSTFFSFRLSNPGGIGDEDGQGADGIVFTVQTVANTSGGAGGGIGYQGIANSLGIEFDTYNNGSGLNDPNGNHIGIDTAGNIASVATQTYPTRMNDGNVHYSWVDYNGATGQLDVRLADSLSRPIAANLSYNLDLGAILGSANAFVGFTAGTGAGYNDQDILSWQFNDKYDPINGSVPDVGFTFSMLASGLGGLMLIGRRLRS